MFPRLLPPLIAIVALSGCVPPSGPLIAPSPKPLRIVPPLRGLSEVPAANLPQSLRPFNWVSRSGEGSCANASTVYNLHWSNQPELAAWWRQNHAGGEFESTLIAKHEAAGQRHYYTRRADPAFLDWCTRTRRSAVIWYFTAHAINFAGFHRDADGVTYAYLLDNNRPQQFIKVERSLFLSRWHGYGGFGLALAAAPASPPLYDAIARSDG